MSFFITGITGDMTLIKSLVFAPSWFTTNVVPLPVAVTLSLSITLSLVRVLIQTSCFLWHSKLHSALVVLGYTSSSSK